MADMDRRLAPPHHGIVHGRQVVEDQRGRVDEFDGAARIDGGLQVAAEILSGQHGHQRPQPLARREHAGADRRIEARLPGDRLRNHHREACIDLADEGGHGIEGLAGLGVGRHGEGVDRGVIKGVAVLLLL